jgi:hypothetical protein
MSGFGQEAFFQGQAPDDKAAGAATGQAPPQSGMPQQLETGNGQFQGGNMGGGPDSAGAAPGGENKTTLW